MSSLAAARADNFYYPKEWRPEHGSINKFHKSHPLGKRAKDIQDGVLVVRFEMPFNVWCTHCELHVGRGVRYNAKKKRVGMYFSTILYEFRMNCTQCRGEMVIETDPEHRGYKLVSGIKKQATIADEDGEGGDVGGEIIEEMETERLNDSSVGIKAAADPFFKLEHAQEDRRRAKQRASGLEAIVEVQDAQYRDNYASNAALRATFRSQKKHLQTNAARAEALGLGITLVDACPEDIAISKATVFQDIPGRSKMYDGSGKRGSGSTHRSMKRKASEDSFQYFGDSVGSKLHRLKLAKKQSRKSSSTTAQTPAAKQTTDRVSSRAKRLLLQ